MKVLEKGDVRPWSREVECTGRGNTRKANGDPSVPCGARLLVEKGDLFQTYSSFMGRDEEWFITIECPECGTWTDIEAPFDPQGLPKYKERK